MALCSIELETFARLVSSLEGLADGGLSGDANGLRGELTGVNLPTAPVQPVDGVLGWLDDAVMEVRRRLALARAVEASTPGQQLYVQFDDSQLSTKSPSEVEADARLVAEWLESGEADIPDEVLDILDGSSTDPYFAKALAEQTSVEDLAMAVRSAAASRDTILRYGNAAEWAGDMADWEDRYTLLIDGLGTTMGTASMGSGDLAPPAGFTQAWIDGIVEREMPGQASALALLVSRGRWSTDFTVDVTQAIYASEQSDNGGFRGMWSTDANPGMGMYVGAITPAGEPAYDPLALVLQAVAKDPEAGIRLFEESGEVTVTVDGEDHQVSGFMDYVISQRKWPVDGGEAAMAAVTIAATPYEGGSTLSAVVASDARLASEAFKQDVESRGDDAPWWSSIGHLVLDVVGMVPVIGEPIDAVNGIWYFAEGNVIDGSLSMVALVPIGGQAATATKWGRKVLKGEDAVAVLKNLDNVRLDDSLESVQLLAKADNASPGVFDFTSLDELNAAANKAHPGVTYRHNGMSWVTDELGRTKAVDGQLSLRSGDVDPSLRRDVGNGPDARDSDVGFHLIADSMGGPTNRLNVLPGNGKPIDDGLANLNQGEYASMERALRGALADGRAVEFNMDVIYPPGGTTRPERFEVTAFIDGVAVEFGPFINK